MARAASAVVLLLLVAAIDGINGSANHRLDLIRVLSQKPWMVLNQNKIWDRLPGIHLDLGPAVQDDMPQLQDLNEEKPDDVNEDDDAMKALVDGDVLRETSEKRSAVATALNAGRRRRQPSPALGKPVTPYVGVGILNDVDTFFDSLRDNLETLASLSPQQRANIFQEPPSVVHAPSHGSGGGGSGFKKLHALRPLRPTGNIRSYNRRSFVEADGVYPGANHHDPGLLWTGLGRRR